MTSLMQVLRIGASGLEAATAGMATVSNNTANATTSGYNVETVSQSALVGPGGMSWGTQVSTIGREFNQFAFQNVVHAASGNQAAQTVLSNSQALGSIFPVASGGAGGLGADLSGFFAAANTLSQAPASIPNREAFLAQAQSLAGQFRSAAQQLAQNAAAIDGQLSASVQQINALTAQIASLNQQVAQQAPGSVPNALLDQREQLVQQLGQQVGVTVLPAANGMLDVYAASGAALVSGTNSFRLSVGTGAYGDGSSAIVYAASGQDLANSLSGGAVGGLLASLAQVTDAENRVGAIAAELAAAVNAQQSLGLNLDGKPGQALFAVAAPTVYAAAANTGDGQLTAAITDPAQFSPGDFILKKTAGGFEAANLATGETTALGSGPTLNFNGMTLTVSGTVQDGDSFKLRPTAAAAATIAVTASDPRGIAAAAPYVVTAGRTDGDGNVTGPNQGNIAATVGGPVASGALPSGALVLPATAFGQTLSVVFTSATDFDIRAGGGAVLASGSVGAGAETTIAIPMPSPTPSGTVETVTLSAGTAAAGDTFTLIPGGSGSNGNIAALAGLATQPLLSGQSLGNAYATLVTQIGGYGQEAAVAATAAQGVLNQAQQVQQSISGVNLDEEAANLVAFQQAYQASAQVISVTQTLFQELLNAL